MLWALSGALQKATSGGRGGRDQHITSPGKATALPPPAGPSAAGVAAGLSLWSVHLLNGLVWRGERGRHGILSNPEI